MKTYYLLEIAETFEYNKIGLFDTVDEVYQWLVENYDYKLDELVEDAKHGFEMYDVKITPITVLAEIHDVNEDC